MLTNFETETKWHPPLVSQDKSIMPSANDPEDIYNILSWSEFWKILLSEISSIAYAKKKKSVWEYQERSILATLGLDK